MRANHIICAAAVVFSIAALSARAELKWENTTIELNAAPAEKEVVGHFKYKNTSEQPIRFVSVKSSCGCTVASLKKDVVAPGESGEITATFKIGGRTGLQQKTVRVETDDPKQPSTTLTLKTAVGQWLSLQPSFIFWGFGEEPKTKTIVVRAAKNAPVRDLKVSSSSSDFNLKVQRVGEGGEFRIEVRPKQTSQPVSATLAIQADPALEGTKPLSATARVMPAASAAR